MTLFILSASCAIFLPLVIYFYVKEVLNKQTALISYVLVLSSPYLINLSLSMLSDSIGLLFFFLSLYLYEKKSLKTCALSVCISFFARPSYIILFLVSYVYIYFHKKENLKILSIYFFIFCMFFILYILFYNSTVFFIEAKRFISGHFSLWGRGQNSEYSWFENIFNIYNFIFIFLFFIKVQKKLSLIIFLSFFYFLWIIFAQNPENLRHLIPLVFFVIILISSYLENKKSLFVVIVIVNISIIFSYNNLLSPIDQIINTLNDNKKLILSNRSLEILRNSLNNKVFDKYYKNSYIFYKNKKNIIEITGNKPIKLKYKEYKGRFLGDRKFYLLISDN